MSSPRGLDVGGIGAMGRDVDPRDILSEVGDALRERLMGEVGRENRNDRGLKGTFDRRGARRTFRYMLNDLSALLACGTYLSHYKQVPSIRTMN
jgi:hypothetical protein